jgi:N4-(beta-N-acetylglucosaminyl)-L-asparaginase
MYHAGMSSRLTRREFVQAGAAASVAAAASSVTAQSPSGGPTVLTPSAAKPFVIASANGNHHKNGGPQTAVALAFARIVEGKDVLDAVVEGVSINELDPLDDSVGYGGLPNADGVVQLDSCCMHGPKKRAGGVACLEGIRTPAAVAKLILQTTDHHLLVGRDAQRFAAMNGFTIEPDLNTPNSRKLYLEWKRRADPEHYLDPAKRADAGERARRAMVLDGLIDPEHVYGTINCDGMNAKGEICGVTTTSGLSWKIPGRVGDSPILGAGLYVDNAVGAAGSTGRGEANLYGLCSFLIVEEMRRGKHPKDAALEALRRVKANTIEKRLLTPDGNPTFGLNFYAFNTKGEYAGVSMYRSKFAICTENGPQTLDTTPLIDAKAP